MRACTPHPHTHTLPLYECSHIDPQSSPQCLAAIRLQNKSIPQARTGSSSRVSNVNLQYAENTPVSALFHSLRSWGIFSFKVFLYFKIPAAKLLQSCPTLCDPIDGSPPGSSIHGIFQARTLEWGAIVFSLEKGNFFCQLSSNLSSVDRMWRQQSAEVYHKTVLISPATKVMLKILQTRLQQQVN